MSKIRTLISLGLLVFGLALVSPLAWAKAQGFKRQYGMAGCGLGSILMGKQDGQISAATTNGSTYNQLLGITFGTLNCLDEENKRLVDNVDGFLHINGPKLITEVVRGGGEHTQALAHLFGCQKDLQAPFDQALRKDFSAIFGQNKTTTQDVTDSLISTLLQDQTLRAGCRQIQGFHYG